MREMLGNSFSGSTWNALAKYFLFLALIALLSSINAKVLLDQDLSQQGAAVFLTVILLVGLFWKWPELMFLAMILAVTDVFGLVSLNTVFQFHAMGQSLPIRDVLFALIWLLFVAKLVFTKQRLGLPRLLFFRPFAALLLLFVHQLVISFIVGRTSIIQALLGGRGLLYSSLYYPFSVVLINGNREKAWQRGLLLLAHISALLILVQSVFGIAFPGSGIQGWGTYGPIERVYAPTWEFVAMAGMFYFLKLTNAGRLQLADVVSFSLFSLTLLLSLTRSLWLGFIGGALCVSFIKKGIAIAGSRLKSWLRLLFVTGILLIVLVSLPLGGSILGPIQERLSRVSYDMREGTFASRLRTVQTLNPFQLSAKSLFGHGSSYRGEGNFVSYLYGSETEYGDLLFSSGWIGLFLLLLFFIRFLKQSRTALSENKSALASTCLLAGIGYIIMSVIRMNASTSFTSPESAVVIVAVSVMAETAVSQSLRDKE